MLRTYLISAVGIVVLLFAWVKVQTLWRRLFPESPVDQDESARDHQCAYSCFGDRCDGACKGHIEKTNDEP